MASLFTKCCCVGDCFWGWSSLGDFGDDYGYCSHDTTERLYLRIPRSSFVTSSVGVWPSSCSCSGDFLIRNTASGASDIIAKYAHFPGESGSRLYNWKWYDPNSCLPECSDSCWGYASSGTSDAECCLERTNATKCQSVWFKPHPMSSADFTANYLSKFERDVCSGTPVNRIPSSSSVPVVDGSVTPNKDFGDGFRWIENISDYQTGGGEDRFTKRWWNGSSWVTHSGKKLVETMFVVLHRTKWWKRDFNSLHPNDADPEDGSWCGGAGEPSCGAYASCRTPEYWDYECSGFPIFTWEIYNAPTRVLSDDEKKAMFVAVDNGNGFDHEAMDKLVEHLGCEPKNYKRSDGKTVKRTLVNDDGESVEHYAYAREAGWKHVCYDEDASGKFPQWDTNESNSCNALPSSGDCFTAAPIPQETTCSTVAGSGPGSCAGVSGCSASGTCAPLIVDCDGTNPPTSCALDSAVGDCSGIWFHYNQYCFILPPSGSSVGYSCCVHNQAFLCVVPDAVSTCDCSTLPFDGPDHPIPPGVSDFFRSQGAGSGESVCCGGKGTFAFAPPGIDPYCDSCQRPSIDNCTDPGDSDFCPSIGT